jgi:DNA polymerase delta subunit 1
MDINDACHMVGFGKDVHGGDVCVRAPFTPFFFVRVPDTKQSASASRFFAAQLYDSIRGGLVRQSCRLVAKVPFIGFCHRQLVQFVQLVFVSLDACTQAKYMLRRQKHVLFETNVDPMLKCFHIYDLDPVGWVRISSWTDVADDSCISCVREIGTTMASMRMDRETEEAPPLIVASWDIECVSDTGHFPDSSLPKDRIITIGTAYARFGALDRPFRKTVHQLGTCGAIEGVDVFSYEREHELINAWIRETVDMKTDILLGYNTYGFDHRYLDGRAACLVNFGSGQSKVCMDEWGKMREGCGAPVEKNLTSSAYGDNSYFYHDTPGMISVDLLQIYRKVRFFFIPRQLPTTM